MKEKGGTAFSIIRSTFLNWDADASGEMSKDEVMGALRMLKLNISSAECDALVRYYDLEGDGEMKYQPLVEDITKASPHFLNHPNTARLEREAQESERARVVLDNKPKKVMPRVCELFLQKLRRNLMNIMREKGGTEFSILRTNFLNWDADKSGEIGVREFMGCVNILGLKLSVAEATQIVDYYDLEGDGEMKYGRERASAQKKELELPNDRRQRPTTDASDRQPTPATDNRRQRPTADACSVARAGRIGG
jgi:Ca2+-binding EF-hand superfamily protein